MFAIVVALIVYPHSDAEESEKSDEWTMKLAMNTRAAAIFSHSCADCHSTSTRWPWYSHVPPVSWLIKHDVDRAQKDFNASLWSSYSLAKKREILGDVARVAANKEMPVKQYLLLHRTARLSDTDGDVLVQWARGQRRLLRKPDPEASDVESLPEGGVR
jgi:hypothetical protein